MPSSSLRLTRALLIAWCLVLAPRTDAAPAAQGLQVELSGLPAGLAADVVVTAGDLRRPVTATTALEDLAPGVYVVTASPVRHDGAFVDALYEPEVASARVTVAPGKPATVRVRYLPRGGTGLLWAAAFDDRGAVGLGNAELAAGGKPAGRRVVDTDARYARGLAFAANGGLWVSGDCKGTLVSFAAGQLAAAGSKTPPVAVKPPGQGRCLDGVAIAPDGRVWVADRSSGELLGFAPATLARGGAVAPDVVIRSPDPKRPALRNPSGLAFDARGNLWAANAEGGNTVVMYATGQLAASGSPEPTVTLATSGQSTLFNPRGLAFDAAGNLWVANRYGPVVKFTPAQLRSSGAPKPAAALPTTAIAKQTDLVGIAFDEAGNLWVSNQVNPARLVMFRAADLADPSRAAPATTVDAAFARPGHLALSLPPAGLPVAPAAERTEKGAAAGSAR